MQIVERAASRALPSAGKSMPISKAMIEMTTNSSTKVNPAFNRLCSCSLTYLSLLVASTEAQNLAIFKSNYYTTIAVNSHTPGDSRRWKRLRPQYFPILKV
jgi:hypothetical protein